MDYPRRVYAIVALLIVGILYYDRTGTAILDGRMSMHIKIDSKSKMPIREIEYGIFPTKQDADSQFQYPEDPGMRQILSGDVPSGNVTIDMFVSQHVTGLLGFEKSHGQDGYGIALRIRFADETVQIATAEIPDLRHQPNPYELKINVD